MNSEKCFHQIRFMGGPEVYAISRRREGGTHQHGWLGGARLLLDYQRRFCIYWGVEGAYALGRLRGHTGNHTHIASNMHDASTEGRIGYTFQSKGASQFTFIPFLGMGYLWEGNNFCHPSPLSLHYLTRYWYLTTGAFISVNISSKLNVGLNIKIRTMLSPHCRVSHDPDFHTATLKIGNDSLQYRFELPMIYRCKAAWLSAALEPFYERRSYGRQSAYPFDFMQTTYINAGASLRAIITF